MGKNLDGKDFEVTEPWEKDKRYVKAKEFILGRLTYYSSYSGELEQMRNKTEAAVDRLAMLVEILYSSDVLTKEQVEKIAKGY